MRNTGTTPREGREERGDADRQREAERDGARSGARDKAGWRKHPPEPGAEPPYLDRLGVGHPVQGLAVDPQDLIADAQPLPLGQGARFHQRHVDAHAVLGAAADAEAQTLVGFAPAQRHLPQLARDHRRRGGGRRGAAGRRQVGPLGRVLIEEELVGARQDEAQ